MKAFVEFQTAQETAIVKQKLDHETIEELGISVRAFFSQRDKISVASNNPYAKGESLLRSSFCHFMGLGADFERFRRLHSA